MEEETLDKWMFQNKESAQKILEKNKGEKEIVLNLASGRVVEIKYQSNEKGSIELNMIKIFDENGKIVH